MWTYDSSYELYHFGVKGMKWGRRKARPQTAEYSRMRDARSEYKTARSQYKQSQKDARAAQRQARQAERNTPEAKAKRAKRAKTAAIAGAAVVTAALAAYGGYKMNKFVKEKHSLIQAEREFFRSEKEFNSTAWALRSRAPGQKHGSGFAVSNSGNNALDAGARASKDNFRTALKNVRDYRKQEGSLSGLRTMDYYKRNREGSRWSWSY